MPDLTASSDVGVTTNASQTSRSAKPRRPRVYVVQRPAYRDRATGEWVDKFDLSAAEEFGALVYLLPPGNVARNPDQTVARLDHRLNDYISGHDHLLAAGDPVAIAMAAVRAVFWARGPISMLKWDRLDQRYYAYVVPFSNEG